MLLVEVGKPTVGPEPSQTEPVTAEIGPDFTTGRYRWTRFCVLSIMNSLKRNFRNVFSIQLFYVYTMYTNFKLLIKILLVPDIRPSLKKKTKKQKR